jgi:CheY-like chemotaxis protein
MGTRTVLHVDDDALIRRLTREAFRRCDDAVGFLEADGGTEAMGWIARWEQGEPRPSLVLLDLEMPLIGGLQVLTALKSHSRFRYIPVVMFTSSNDPRNLSAAYLAGANSYVLKPVLFDEYLASAHDILRYWLRRNQVAD